MSAAAFVEEAHAFVRILEERAARTFGLDSVEEARPIVARETDVPVGTLRSIRKRRLKSIGAQVYAGPRNGVIRALEAELRHVQHELEILRQTGADPRASGFQSALASEARIREALGLDAPNGEAQ